MQDKVVFWGIPKSSKVKKSKSERRNFNLLTDIVVLENYNQKISKTLSIQSNPQDGGMCDFQPKVGIPQLITAYPHEEGYWGFSTCACEIPPKQLFDYLELGIDTFIPDPSDCSKDNKVDACNVWESLNDHSDLLWSKQLNYFPYSKHTEKLFSEK